MVRPMIRWALAIVLTLASVATAFAQAVQYRVLEERPDGAVFEMTVTWPSSLQAALDSIDATVFDERVALAVARGLFTTSRTLALPALVQPRLRDRKSTRLNSSH